MATDEEIRRVATAIADAFSRSGYESMRQAQARAAISEMRAIEREKSEFHIETVTTSSDGPLEARIGSEDT